MNSALSKPKQKLQLRGAILVACSGLLYGFMAFFGTELIKAHFAITTMLFWRFFLAMIWVLFSTSLRQKNIFKHCPSLPTMLRINILGGLSYSGGSVFFFLASKYTGTGVAMVIFFCFPVFVTLYAWVTTKWQMNRHTAASLISILVGLVLLKGHGSNTLSVTGIIFAIVAGLSYAFYVIYSKGNSEYIDSQLLTFLVCLGNAIIFFLLAFFTHHFFIPNSLHIWGYLIALGIVATALPIQLLLDGIKHVSSIKASILSVLEPVVTLLVGILLLNETITYTQAFGIMTILLGAILIQFERPVE